MDEISYVSMLVGVGRRSGRTSFREMNELIHDDFHEPALDASILELSK